MRAPHWLVLASTVMSLGCDSDGATSRPGERPEEPPRPTREPTLRDPSAEPGAILRIPGRGYLAELVGDELLIGADPAEPTYRIEALDGGFMELVGDPEVRWSDVYVRPLSRFRVSIQGDGCGATVVLRSGAATRVTDLESLECVPGGTGDRVSASSSAASPMLDFDLDASRERLVLHDGEGVFVVDAFSAARLPVVSGGRVRPRFAGDVVLYQGTRGVHAYDLDAGVELPGEVANFDTETLVVARDAPVALGGGRAFTWRGGRLDVMWAGNVLFPSTARLSDLGNRVAYSTGDRFVIEGLGDEEFETYYPKQDGSGRVVFTRDGLDEVFLENRLAYHRRRVIASGVVEVAASGTSSVLLVNTDDAFLIHDFESSEQTDVSANIQLDGSIVRTQGFPGVIFVRTETTTYVVDADDASVAHEFEGRWRPYELGGGRFLLVGPWDIPPLELAIRDYPLCGASDSPCSMKMLDDELNVAWSSDAVTGGVPIGANLTEGFEATGRRLNDGCTPAVFVGKDGVRHELEGGACHVQRLPERFFGAPCMPFTVSEGLDEGVYCVR